MGPIVFGVLWIAAVVAITAMPFWWHVEFFKQAGPQFYQLILLLLPVLFVVPLIYRRLRLRGLWRYELKAYLALGVLPCLLYETRGTLGILLLVTSAFSIGYWLQRIAGIESDDPIEEIALSCALGLGVLTTVLLGLGMAQLYRTWILALLLVPAILAWRQFLEDILEVLDDAANANEMQSPLAGIAAFFGAGLVLLAALSALTPPTNGDAIRFHLALAKSYLQSGGLNVPQFIEYGYYPQAYEVLTTTVWGISGLAAAQMLPGFIFLLCLMLLFRIGRQCGYGPAHCFLGTVVAAATPFLHWTGAVVKNDMHLVLYLLASLCCLLRWNLAFEYSPAKRTQAGGEFLDATRPPRPLSARKFRWVQLAVLFAGFGFGVKHTAIFGAVALAPICFVAAWRQTQRLKAFAGLAALIVVVGGMWATRTYLLKGDPTYPEAVTRAVSHGGQTEAVSARFTRYPKLLYQSHFLSRIHFESPSNNAMGVFLLLFLPVWFLVKRVSGNEQVRYVWWFASCYLLYWSTVLSTLRYAAAPILLVFLLLSVRLETVGQKAGQAATWLISCALIYGFVFALLVNVIQELAPPLPGVLTGKITQIDLLRQFLPPFAAMEQLHKSARPEDLVFSAGNWAVAYAPYPAVVNHIYRTDRAYSGKEIASELSKQQYRFLVLPHSPNRLELEEAARRVRAMAELYSDANFHLYLLN